MSVRKPAALRPGDTVAVVAPASASGRRRILRGVRALRALGFRVKLSPQAFARHGHFAGNDARRAKALLGALRDPAVRAVFSVRGGFGAARILPLVEREMARRAPKILVGYSDLTSLLGFATERLGWVAFHGPLVAPDLAKLSASDRRSLLDTLGGGTPRPIRLGVPIRSGVAEGTIVGGCLAILVSLLGTPYAIDFSDRIVFLEDVNEEPYSLDRMLTQLRLAGAFRRARGIVFGEMHNCGTRKKLLAVLHDRTADLGIPVAFGLPSGHGRGKKTLPLGVRARLDTRRRRLELLESPVIATAKSLT